MRFTRRRGSTWLTTSSRENSRKSTLNLFWWQREIKQFKLRSIKWKETSMKHWTWWTNCRGSKATQSTVTSAFNSKSNSRKKPLSSWKSRCAVASNTLKIGSTPLSTTWSTRRRTLFPPQLLSSLVEAVLWWARTWATSSCSQLACTASAGQDAKWVWNWQFSSYT